MKLCVSLANILVLALVALSSKCAVGATQDLQADRLGNSTGDARTLLQEQAWAEAFNWNSTTHMCHWPNVFCDNDTRVYAL